MSKYTNVELDDVIDELNEITATLQDRNANSRDEWSRELKTALCSLGQSKDFTTGASNVDMSRLARSSHSEEQKFSAVWLCYHEARERAQLRYVALAFECMKSNRRGMSAHFQRLLDSTAKYKIFFFWDDNKNQLRRTFQTLENDIEAFEGGAYGTYIFVGCDNNWDTLINIVAPECA